MSLNGQIKFKLREHNLIKNSQKVRPLIPISDDIHNKDKTSSKEKRKKKIRMCFNG